MSPASMLHPEAYILVAKRKIDRALTMRGKTRHGILKFGQRSDSVPSSLVDRKRAFSTGSNPALASSCHSGIIRLPRVICFKGLAVGSYFVSSMHSNIADATLACSPYYLWVLLSGAVHIMAPSFILGLTSRVHVESLWIAPTS